MEDNDRFIDDLAAVGQKAKKKKKVNGKQKGNRTELNLCKLLTNHFGVEFSRALGSGSRWSQVNHMPEHAMKTLIGDLCVPEGFKWVIECKGGYEKEMNLSNLFEGVTCFDDFIAQVTHDAEYCGRTPVIMWKRNRKPWLVALKKSDMGSFNPEKWVNYAVYGDWIMGDLMTLLTNTEKHFWFKKEENDA